MHLKITHDKETRVETKKRFFDRIETALNPPVSEPELESLPVEIVEKYSKWVPASLAIEPVDELLPEFKKESEFIPFREVEKRASLRNRFLDRISQALLPVEPQSESETKTIEILDQYSKGIPQRGREEAEPVFTEERNVLEPVILDSDVPRRWDFKTKLFKKVFDRHQSEEKEDSVEIIGYSQRANPPYGLDYSEIKSRSFLIEQPIKSELELTDFDPVEETPPVPVLRLPKNYAELDERALYGVLVRTPGLQHTSETANLVLDILSGRSEKVVDFEIVDDNPITENQSIAHPVLKTTVEIQEQYRIQDEAKRMMVAKNLVSRVNNAQISETVEDSLPVDEELSEVTVDVTQPLSVIRTELLLKGLTPEQADLFLARLVGSEVASETENENVFESVPEIDDEFDMPEDFMSWQSKNQYIYLTKERKFTPERANEIIWNL